MTQRAGTKPKKRRGFTYLWIFGLALLVALLIWFEQTALLYIFSTLGVTVLLVIVALSDLGKDERLGAETDQSPAATVGKPAK